MAQPTPSTRQSVLVVEDDETIGRHLETGLHSNGYAPQWVRTGTSALAEAELHPYAAVLLDLGLPDIDGIGLARTLRSRRADLLIIILTARTDDIDVVAGLDAGADDYLLKPFSLTVLLARLRAHLRRARPVEDGQPTRIQLGDLTLDIAARRCHLPDGSELDLRPKEFDLLTALARRRGEAVSRETLMSEVWDENWFGPTKTLDVTMAGLRRRLHDSPTAQPGAPRIPVITTLRRHGYRLEA
ncbi:response regulator transcription factor [Streptomyces sp. NPDC058045]|uniref:response regulator transcription factor n=1 Tax=Streptomyces sp. NPDC058045 TaxID=3346311 RepID=UPI0036EACBF5